MPKAKGHGGNMEGKASSRAKRCLVAAAMTVLLAWPALAQSTSPAPALTNEQSQAVQQLIHDYILNHPDVVFQSLKNEQQQMAQQKEASSREMIAAKQKELLADPTSPTGGNPKGDVTIVEFFDYRCPYCKAVEPSLETLLKDDPKVRIVYKEFPILGPASIYAAEVALSAQKQGKYMAFHNAMMGTKGTIDDATVRGVAQLAGLNMDQVDADISSPAFGAIFRRNYELAAALNIGGTPGFVIGTQVADGSADIDSLKQMIAAARQSPGQAE